MTDEQFENRMEFIVEQQAKFAVDIQLLQESQRELQESQRELKDSQQQTDGMIRNLVDVNLSLAGHVEGLTNHLQQVDERLDRLAESQVHSDQRLDALIDVVDKLVRRNGGGNPRA